MVRRAPLGKDRRLEKEIDFEANAEASSGVSLPGIFSAERAGPGTSFLEAANLHRELFPGVCPGPLVLWMTELLERAVGQRAPDLWHWRSHVFNLWTRSVSPEVIAAADRQALPSDDYRRHPEDRLLRLEEELVAYRKAGMIDDEYRVLNSIGLARFDAGDTRHALRDFG